MAESSSSQTLKEWGMPIDLVQKLPRRSHGGLLSQEVKITCIHTIPEFIALGTNTGLVCWYNRAKRELQKLQCDNPVQITTVRVISTVDYMLACGTVAGTINIFQIPKVHPEGIPENLKPKKQQVERYLVSDVHKAPVSALEWSKNGMKLFSGDKEGIIVLTELDFYMHICKSIEILNESYEVVQLSYYNQILLISTTYRTIVCRKVNKWKITQVGKKGRKLFGNYGGLIYSNTSKPNDSIIYCTRPGLRVWISDMEGNVQKTILFKDALRKKDVYMTNMSASTILQMEDESTFGTIATFRDNLLVTYCEKVVYVLDPQKMGVVRTYRSSGRILDVSTNKDEIFILQEGFNMVRLAYEPEFINQETRFGLPVNVFPVSMNILGLTLDGYTPGISSDSEHSESHIPTNAEEAIECTGEETCFDESDFKKVSRKNSSETVNTTYSKIAQEDYDDNIIFRHRRYSKSQTRSTTDNGFYGFSGDEGRKSRSFQGVKVLPDLRSPESIRNDIETKEKLISEMLDFDRIKIKIPQLGMREGSEPTGSETKSESQTNTLLKDIKNSVANTKEISISNNLSNSNSQENIPISNSNKELTPFIPDVLSIPSEWNLSCVELNTRERTKTESDVSLNDWEII